MAKNKPEGYLSAKESRRISRENRRITNQFEKERKRKNVPESEYTTTMHNPENAVEFDNLHTYFFTDAGTVKSVDGVSFEVPIGKTVGVVGESGCGKTTLLKVLGLIDKQTGGELYFCGKETGKIRGDSLARLRLRRIGFVFQDFYLMDSLTVEENIMLPMILGKEKKGRMVKETRGHAEKFQIAHLLKKYPYELSGGEKQRTAICRALINDPDLILADEPTGNLDSKSGQIVIDALDKINGEYKKTIVMVTHGPQMASFCSRILLLKDGMILDELVKKDGRKEFYQEILERMGEL